jgi:predicted kinase
MGKMYIMRGVPGSGKSYLAQQTANMFDPSHVVVLSTDSIWETQPARHYLWIAEFIGAAHRITQAKARESCAREIPYVIIDNTNTTLKEMQPYIDIAKDFEYDVVFLEPQTEWAKNADECFRRNQHSVPREVIQKMLDRFESTESVKERMNA